MSSFANTSHFPPPILPSVPQLGEDPFSRVSASKFIRFIGSGARTSSESNDKMKMKYD